MNDSNIVKSITWTLMARMDIADISENIRLYTKSKQAAQNVVADILFTIRGIKYINQYQIDVFLGEPYRRIIVRDYKVVYKKDDNNKIVILAVIPTRKQPKEKL